jgi:hypothetical protein
MGQALDTGPWKALSKSAITRAHAAWDQATDAPGLLRDLLAQEKHDSRARLSGQFLAAVDGVSRDASRYSSDTAVLAALVLDALDVVATQVDAFLLYFEVGACIPA